MKRSGIASSGGLKRSPMAAGGAQLKRSPMAAGTATMKRSQMAASSAPMKRTEMKRTTGLIATSSLQRSWIKVEAPAAGVMAPRRRMRSKGPRMTPIRKSARDESCTLAIPGICRNRTDTTVWAHSNRLADGKGIGFKADDEAGCYACFDCHSFLDGGWAAFAEWTYDRVQQYFEVARAKSRVILQHKGLIKNDQQQ